MKLFCAVVTLLCSISALANAQLTVSITCANTINQIFADGVQIAPPFPPFYDDWSNADSIVINNTLTRIIAIRGVNTVAGSCSGILATLSYPDNSIYNTDNINWKCSSSPLSGWQNVGFDDSTWEIAFSTGLNSEIVPGCSRVPIDNIALNAHWIWTSGYIDYDLVVSCRGYTPVCRESPCLNNGICQNNTGNLCLCPVGYTGTFCETEFDECSSNPCVQGICINDENGYTCQCNINWTGTYCETDLSECSSNPCQNNATCSFTSPGYECSCAPGFTGVHCESDIDECESNPCEFGGTCHDLVNGFSCTCAGGYTGNFCQTDINECESNPCVNGASCRDDINGFTCQCLGGYTGIHCETGIGNCESSPCLNGGTCIDDPLIPDRCRCPEEWALPFCGVSNDPCANAPCRNGGTCNTFGPSYNCTCPPTLEGIHCENAVADCGDLLTQSTIAPTPGFWALCHITSLQQELANTPCRDLIINISNYGNASDIVAMGGSFGCYNALLEADTINACSSGYRNDLTLSQCGTMCNYMGVCISVPPLP